MVAHGTMIRTRLLRSIPIVVLATAVTSLLNMGESRANAATLSGSLTYETFGYPDSGTRGSDWENFFELLLRGSGRLNTRLTYHFETRLVADDADFTADFYSFRNDDLHRSYLSLISAALDCQVTKRLRASLGRQVLNWSIIDEIKPAALMLWREESDIFRRTDHGVDALSLHYSMDNAFVELAVVPIAFTPSTLPQGRWNPMPSGMPLVRNLPPVRGDETQAGVRLGLSIGDLDATIIGYEGRSTLPVFQLAMNGEDFTPEIDANYPRLHAAGFTASYPVGEGVLLRTEAVYFASPDNGVEDFLQAVAGAEYSYGDWRFIINYLQADKIVRDPAAILAEGERRYFQEFLFGEARYDAGGRLRVRFRGGYDFAGEFAVVQPEVSLQLWGELEIAMVAEVITSGRFSYFDVIRNEDRVGTRLRYYF